MLHFLFTPSKSNQIGILTEEFASLKKLPNMSTFSMLNIHIPMPFSGDLLRHEPALWLSRREDLQPDEPDLTRVFEK